MKVSVGITHDHRLFIKGLSQVINRFKNFEVIIDAPNGKDLLDRLALTNKLPEIVLIDVNMPVMDGVDTAQALSVRYPSVKMVALSVDEKDIRVIGMIRAGCCAYFMKYIEPDGLEKALMTINRQRYYNPDIKSHIDVGNLIRIALGKKEVLILTELENKFLQFASTDLCAREIAENMDLPAKTLDRYYESLCNKLNVETRAGMVLEAVKRNLVSI